MSHKNKYNQPSQFELFPETPLPVEKKLKKRYLLKDLTLSIENIIVLSIIFVLTLVLFFSFGVERGKNVVDIQDIEQGSDDIQIVQKESVQKIPEVSKDFVVLESVPEEKVESVNSILEEQILEIEITEQIYTIQVASFRLEKSAKREAVKLKDIGYDTFVLPKGDYSIVCVGKFFEKSQAKTFSDKLKNRYNDLLVRRF